MTDIEAIEYAILYMEEVPDYRVKAKGNTADAINSLKATLGVIKQYRDLDVNQCPNCAEPLYLSPTGITCINNCNLGA